MIAIGGPPKHGSTRRALLAVVHPECRGVEHRVGGPDRRTAQRPGRRNPRLAGEHGAGARRTDRTRPRAACPGTHRGGCACARPDVELVLYRIAQESLTNVLRHAGAGHALVQLRLADDAVILDVHDDGNGVDLAAARADGGLRGKRERAVRVGGILKVASRSGAGTRVRLICRWRDRAPAPQSGPVCLPITRAREPSSPA